jgi:hypothetical protein
MESVAEPVGASAHSAEIFRHTRPGVFSEGCSVFCEIADDGIRQS